MFRGDELSVFLSFTVTSAKKLDSFQLDNQVPSGWIWVFVLALNTDCSLVLWPRSFRWKHVHVPWTVLPWLKQQNTFPVNPVWLNKCNHFQYRTSAINLAFVVYWMKQFRPFSAKMTWIGQQLCFSKKKNFSNYILQPYIEKKMATLH